MLASLTRIQPLMPVRRERLLPVPGRVVARKGQKVGATDIVAEAEYSVEHLWLDIARGLRVPVDKADHALQCRVGDHISAGDILAGPVGWMQRVIRSPRDGQVVVVGGGQVLLSVKSAPIELRAGYPGMVVDLVDGRGVIIETSGALIQGFWGNGRIDFGLLNVLARSPDEKLTPDRLDVSMRGSVILAGYCMQAEALHAAAELPLRGLILSALHPDLLPLAAGLPFPLIVIEGFGTLPMNSTAYKLLSTNERREVALNAEPWDRLRGARPEVFIPLPAPENLSQAPEITDFLEGQQVRVLRAPYAGKIGKLQRIHPDPAVLPNGIKTLVGEVRLEVGETAILPLVNLEVIQ